MQILDIITILVFITGILVSGMLFARSGRDVKNFFSAGGAVPWPMAGLSLFMGFFSAGTFVVWGSIAYSFGWTAITIQWGMCLAGLLVGLFIARKWHSTGVLTAAQYINSRLGTGTQKTYTVLFLFVSLFTTGSFLYPVGKIIEVTTGMPLATSIILIGAISILYVAVGGLRAVVVTDVLQFVILFAAVLIVIPLSFGRAGGVQEWISSVPSGFFKMTGGEYTWAFVIAYAFYNMVFIGGNWAYVQRYTSVKDGRSARKVGLLFGGLYAICPVLWMLPPMIYRSINPDLSGLGDEGAYLLMCKEVLPSGILGLMLGGMIFATASSLNATLNISSAVFTNDIFKRLRPSSSERSLMKVARVSTIAFGVLAVAVALLIPKMGGVVNVVISVGALTGVPLYLPVVWSLFSKRQTGKSVLAVTLLSLGVNLFFKFVSPALLGLTLTRTQETVLGVGFPVLCLALFEAFCAVTGKKSSAQYESYAAARASEPQKQESEPSASKADNAFSVQVVGAGVGIAGTIICVLGLVAGMPEAITVCLAGLLLLAVGGVVYSKGRKLKKSV